MTKRDFGKTVGQLIVEDARKRGLEVRTVVIPETPESARTHREVMAYLKSVREFEEESRKRASDILVGGDNCGYCRRAREMQGRSY